MADVYEFHVAGAIGPVLRSALADLSANVPDRQSVLTGTADDPAVIDHVLRRLDACGLVPTEIRISHENRWHIPSDQD